MDIEIRHDQSVTLWKKCGDNIQLIHHWELERITGIKQHGKSFYNIKQAIGLINLLISEYSLKIEDIQEIWGSPQLQTEKIFSEEENPNITFHSLAHLYSGLLMDMNCFRNESILALSIDGGSDSALDSVGLKKCHFVGAVSKKGKVIDILPVCSPGLIWGIAAKLFNMREGTLMALANSSKSYLYSYENELIPIKHMGYYRWIEEYLCELKEKVFALSKLDEGTLFNGFDMQFTEEENKISMIMKQIQRLSIQMICDNIDEIVDKHQLDTKKMFISITGGYALNCPTNSYVMQKYGFKGFIAPPCVSDCGISIGIGLYAFFKKLGCNFIFKMEGAFYGNQDDNVLEVITKSPWKEYVKSFEPMEIKKCVEDVINEPIVWFQGRAEIGPRALGNRSILADPRNKESKDKLNLIKQREWWRPVAPVILEEDIHDWFMDVYPSPFMLHTFKIKENRSEFIPAVMHLDDSSRLQTVNESQNTVLHKVICAFKEKTGIPILCNTSLNDRGEPIIDRIEEAFNFAVRKKINVMYINNYRIELHNHDMYMNTNCEKRIFDFSVYKNESERLNLLIRENALGLERKLISQYYHFPYANEKYKLNDEHDMRVFKRIISVYNNKIKHQIDVKRLKSNDIERKLKDEN